MKSNTQSLVIRAAVYAASCITISILVIIVGYILINGIPNLSFDLFALKYSSEQVYYHVLRTPLDR